MKRKQLLLFGTCLFLTFHIQAQISISLSGDGPSCFGYTNGTIFSEVTDGAEPFIYLWNNGYSSANLSGVAAGDYSVTVTDANGATAEASYNLVGAAELVATPTVDDICAGDGNVTSNVTGGTLPYSYQWSDGQTDENATGLAPGYQCVTITDANGCNAIGCTAVYAELTVEVLTNGLACFLACDASVEAQISGGVGPYSYLWNIGATTSIVPNLPSGFYEVTVTDGNGCVAVGNNTVGSPADLIVTVDVTNPACGTSGLGTATASATGGTPPYNFIWSNGHFGPTATNLEPGEYTLTLTDANNCINIQQVAIVPEDDIAVNVSATPTSLCGLADGTATASASGGTPPYSYEWSTGDVGTSISGLSPGTYFVTVTDDNGCAAVGSTEVGGSPDLEIMMNGNNVSCNSDNDGTVFVMNVSGTPPYNIMWSNGATTQMNSNVPAGTYSVTVTDAAGCQATGSFTIEQDPALEVEASATDTNCEGDAVGTATVNIISGGSAPFSYFWNTGSGASSINGLAPGTYSVTVTDVNGCVGVSSATVAQPPALSTNIVGTNLNCYGDGGGSASVGITGGTPPFSFEWSNTASTASISGLDAGTYSVTVTDASGCQEINSVTITSPPDLNVDTQTTSTTCPGNADGGASAEGSGGTPPYNYFWSTGANTAVVSNLAPGTYTVTVSDINLCIAIGSVTVQEVQAPSCVATISSGISTVGGSDATATVQGSGGTPPYSYEWSNGQSGDMATDLGEGTHSVTITDANGCTSTCSVTVVGPAKVGDLVWIDLNRDGCQDADEPGLHDVVVILTGTDVYGNTSSVYDTTDLLGAYLFDGVTPGNYHLNFFIPVGYVFSDRDNCNNDETDSDVDVDTGQSDDFVLNSGDCILTKDAGIHLKCVNVTDPGEIEGDEALCGPGQDPGIISELSPASGGIGDIEYLWMFSTTPGPFNSSNWMIIPGANGPTYDPGPIYETTYYVRCARSECCNNYLESNVVEKLISTPTAAVIEGPTTTCVGDTYSYTTVNLGPDATYSWNFGPWATPQTSSNQAVNVTFNSWGVTTVTLTVTHGACTSNTSEQIAITNNPIYCGGGLIINLDPNPSGVAIAWELELHTNNWDFIVQRSKDDFFYEDIVVIPASISQDQYSYFDGEPQRGHYYYRIKMDDGNGNHFYSNVKKAIMQDETQFFIVYPNPVEDFLTIDVQEDVTSAVGFKVFSSLGELVIQEEIDENAIRHEMNFADLPAGVYFLRLSFNKIGDQTYRLVKK